MTCGFWLSIQFFFCFRVLNLVYLVFCIGKRTLYKTFFFVFSFRLLNECGLVFLGVFCFWNYFLYLRVFLYFPRFFLVLHLFSGALKRSSTQSHHKFSWIFYILYFLDVSFVRSKRSLFSLWWFYFLNPAIISLSVSHENYGFTIVQPNNI